MNALIEVMQALYKSEINVQIESFWDGGWTVKLGDEMNGFVAEKTLSNEDLPKAAAWLVERAMAIYPGSDFAKRAA